MTPISRRARTATAGLALAAAALAPVLQQLPAQATGSPVGPAQDTPLVHTIGDTVAGLADIDGAGPAAAPTGAQTSAAHALGGDVSVTWNAAGTPASIFAKDGSLGPASGDGAVATARSWVAAHRDVLGLTQAQVDDLELVSDQPFADSAARAVLLRQRIGDLVPATRGMVTVGVAADGSVAYVSSSLVKPDGTAPADVLTPQQGWLKAASSVGRTLHAADITQITS